MSMARPKLISVIILLRLIIVLTVVPVFRGTLNQFMIVAVVPVAPMVLVPVTLAVAVFS